MKRRLLILFSLVALCLPLFSFALPGTASAAVTAADIRNASGKMQDFATVIVSVGSTDLTFKETSYSRSGSYVYKVQNYPCFGELWIDAGGNFKKGNLDLDYQATQSANGVPACVNVGDKNDKISIKISDSQNSKILYALSSDGKQIASVGDGKTTFSLSSTHPGLFVRDSESGKACQDVIVANLSNNTYKLYELASASSSSASNTNAPASTFSTGCKTVKPDKQSLGQNGVTLPLGHSSKPAVAPTGSNGNGSSDSSGNGQLDCDTKFSNPLTWVICPVIDVLAGFIDVVDGLITNMMTIETGSIFCDSGPDAKTCDAYYTAWQSFRNIALGLMVIAGLIVVISQAIGTELVDAYTIRKVLPRLLIAALGITLSWSLMKFAVELTNDLGFGIRHLIYLPFSQLGSTIDPSFGSNTGGTAANIFFAGAGVASVATGAASTAFLLIGGPGALLGFAATAAMAVFIAITVLILREIAIIMLIIVAPLAIVAYILPNTQKAYKFWWESFSKALLMFPLIAAFIATGRVFAAVSLSTGGPFNQLIGFIAYFAPYFMIPLTFKFAGSFVGQLGGFVNSRGGGVFDGLKKYRANRRKSGLERVRKGDVFRGVPNKSYRSKLNRGWQAASLANPDEVGYNPAKWRANARGIRERIDMANSFKAAGGESPSYAPLMGDDDVGHALLHGKGNDADTRAYLRATGRSEEGINQAMAHIDLAKREMGMPALMQTAFLSTMQSGTAYSNDPIAEAYNAELDKDPAKANVPRMRVKRGAGDVLSDIDYISNGNSSTKAQLIGKAKEFAPRSGRADLVGSFSTSLGEIDEISKAKTTAEREKAIVAATEAIQDETVRVEGAGTVLGGKGAAVENLLPALQRRIERSAKYEQTTHNELEQVLAGQQVIVDQGKPTQRVLTEEEGLKRYDAAERQAIQVLASTKALHDVAGQISQEKATLIADGLFGQPIPGTDKTVLDSMNDVMETRRFNEMRNEIRSNYGRQVTEAQQRAAAANTQLPEGFTPPPGASPTPPSN